LKHKLLAWALLIAGFFFATGLLSASAIQPDGGVSVEPVAHPVAANSDQILRTSPRRVGKLVRVGAKLRTLSLDPRPLWPIVGNEAIPLAITPSPDIQAMIDQVDGDTLYRYVGDLSGEWPATIGGISYTITTRHTDSGESSQKATQYAYEHLESLGLEASYHYWSGSGHSSRNVIAEFAGAMHRDEIYVLSAHLDNMPTGTTAPGADDNASGAAAVLVAADILSQYEWDCTLRFALWTGEEQGLWGSHYYAQQASNNGENIVGVLNLDMIGWDGIEGPDIDLHANQSLTPTLDLAQLFSDVVGIYELNLAPQIVPNGIARSDHGSFWDYGYPAILGIEDYDPNGHDFNPYYHSQQDLLEHLNVDYFTEFVKASVGTLAHMGCLRPGHPSQPHFYLPLILRNG
jgi:hypothetical protein